MHTKFVTVIVWNESGGNTRQNAFNPLGERRSIMNFCGFGNNSLLILVIIIILLSDSGFGCGGGCRHDRDRDCDCGCGCGCC